MREHWGIWGVASVRWVLAACSALAVVGCGAAGAEARRTGAGAGEGVDVVGAVGAVGAVPVAELKASIDSTVVAVMAEDRIPGAAVVFVRDGRVVFAEGYGYADVGEGRRVSVEETLFRIGSVSKVLTALGLARLVDQGVIGLDTRVGDHVDGDVTAGPGGAPIRVRHLLTHTAGYDQTGLGRQVDDPAARPSLATFAGRELRPIRRPGRVGVYDTYGITLAGHLIERITGARYAEWMRAEVFAPLGMRDSWVEAPVGERDVLATGYGLEGGDLIAQSYEWYVTLPASSIDATTSDMGRLLVALLKDGGGLVSPEMAARIRADPLFSYGGMGAFSWGFWEEVRGGYRALHHGGVMRGYSSELYLVPAAGIGFFVAYNRDPETGPAPRLRDALTDLLYERSLPRTGSTPDPTPAAPPPTGAPVPSPAVAGAYGSTVGCFTCSEGEGWGLQTLTVATGEPGVISLYGGTARFVAEEPLVYRSEQSGRELRFLTDEDGRVRYMVQGPNSFARLDSLLLDEVLGSGWPDRPATALEARVHRANGHWDAAARAYADLADRRPDEGRVAFYEGFSLLNGGRYAPAAAAFTRALDLGQWRGWSQYYIAAARAGAGDIEAAWTALDQALELGFDDAGLLQRDPWWESHRQDPRYQAALQRLR